MAEGRGGVAKKFLGHTTPSARANVASRLSLDRAATPPPAEEGSLEPLPRLSLRSTSMDLLQINESIIHFFECKISRQSQ